MAETEAPDPELPGESVIVTVIVPVPYPDPSFFRVIFTMLPLIGETMAMAVAPVPPPVSEMV